MTTAPDPFDDPTVHAQHHYEQSRRVLAQAAATGNPEAQQQLLERALREAWEAGWWTRAVPNRGRRTSNPFDPEAGEVRS